MVSIKASSSLILWPASLHSPYYSCPPALGQDSMSGKSMRLSFKGDPKLKKKKKSSASSSTATDGIDTKGKRRARDGGGAAAESDVEDVGGDEQGECR